MRKTEPVRLIRQEGPREISTFYRKHLGECCYYSVWQITVRIESNCKRSIYFLFKSSRRYRNIMSGTLNTCEEEYAKDPNIKPEDIRSLKQWLEKEPHLPKVKGQSNGQN